MLRPLLAAVLFCSSAAGLATPVMAKVSGWNAAGAARYLDDSERRWSNWERAQLEENTFCVSCHTTSLYALARPGLRRHLGEAAPAAEEAKLWDNVVRRNAGWNRLGPYYSDQRDGLPKTSEARGVEAVFNALILANRDREAGKLGDDTRQAFKNMWALQLQKGEVAGAWAWINFHLDPWESDTSPFYGVCFAALAVGMAPENYAATAEIGPKLTALRGYVQWHVGQQNLFNTATALWVSSYLPDLLTPEQKAAIKARLLQAQATDGSWTFSAFGEWKRLDGSPPDTAGDGYGTGLAVLALKAVRDPAAANPIKRGEAWLKTRQDGSGMWYTPSVNKLREKGTVRGQFTTDAATAVAVLALTAP